MKALLLISNGRGIIAEGDDMDALHSAYDKVLDEHHDGLITHHGAAEQHLPAFKALTPCHEETETGAVCILDTAELPHAAHEYYLAGFLAGPNAGGQTPPS